MATLGEQSVGSIVKLNVNGVATNFIVAHHGLPGSMYDSSCDGVWLLMESVYEKRPRTLSSPNSYENSVVHNYLNNEFLGFFDDDIRDAVKQVKIPYRAGLKNNVPVSSGANGLPAKIFLLSYAELGYGANTAIQTDGASLGYFYGASDSQRVALYQGAASSWWLRSMYNDIGQVYVRTSGSITQTSSYSVNGGVRPAMVLPDELTVAADGTIAVANGAITGNVIIEGVQRELTGSGYINIGGVLRDLSDSQVNIGGVLKSLKG